MNRTLVFLLFAGLQLSCFSVWAQDILFSKPQKIAGKISQFEFVGKTNTGILVHKWGDKINLLESYDSETLNLRWTKEIKLGEQDKKTRVVKIIPYHDDLLIIYTVKQKKKLLLTVRKTKTDLQTLSPDVVLDTIKLKFGSALPRYSVEVAQNREYIGVVKRIFNFNGLAEVDCFVLNKDGKLLGNNQVSVPNKTSLKQTFVNNSGKLFVILAKQKRTLLGNKRQYEYVSLTTYNFKNKQTKELTLAKEKHYFNDIVLGTDDKNNQVILAGFYNQKGNDAANGYCYFQIDALQNTIISSTFTPFSDAFIEKAQINSNFKNKKQIANLMVDQLVLRNDGGALLIGESFYTSSQYGARNALSPYYSNRTNETTNYYYDDVILLSINPDGSLLWNSILQKRQFSEEDKGYFSSFGVVNTRDKLNLIFNEEISFNTNINSYILTSLGNYKIGSLFNVRDYELRVAPRYSKQLSENEILMPAFNRRNQFMLTKITF